MDTIHPKAAKPHVVVRKEKRRARMVLQTLGVRIRRAHHPQRPTETRFSLCRHTLANGFSYGMVGGDRHQLRVILDEIQHWDGLHGYGEQRYFSAFREDADFIQFAAHATGLRNADCQSYPDKPAWRPTYRPNQGPLEALKRSDVEPGHRDSHAKFEDGKQYCFTGANWVFIVRHEGTVFVTGNSGKSSGCVIEGSCAAPKRRSWGQTAFAAVAGPRSVTHSASSMTPRSARCFSGYRPSISEMYVQDHRFVIKGVSGLRV